MEGSESAILNHSGDAGWVDTGQDLSPQRRMDGGTKVRGDYTAKWVGNGQFPEGPSTPGQRRPTRMFAVDFTGTADVFLSPAM